MNAFVIGAGPVGLYTAALMAQRGDRVTVLEQHRFGAASERSARPSVDLAVSSRGLRLLAELGLDRDVRLAAAPARGRDVHLASGNTRFEAYSERIDHLLYFLPRHALRGLLLDAASRLGVRIEFGFRCAGLESDPSRLVFARGARPRRVEFGRSVVIAADGFRSPLRHALARLGRFDVHTHYLPYGYVELTLSAQVAMRADALHAWRRGPATLLAFPTRTGAWTLFLQMPFAGPTSFASVRTSRALRELFATNFADLPPPTSDMTKQFLSASPNSIGMVRCVPWHDGRIVLVGDAAHAVVPHLGQGVTLGFESAAELVQQLHRGVSRSRAYTNFERAHRRNADAMAVLAMRHEATLTGRGRAHAAVHARIAAALCAARVRAPRTYEHVAFSSTPFATVLERELAYESIVRVAHALAGPRPSPQAIRRAVRKVVALGTRRIAQELVSPCGQT